MLELKNIRVTRGKNEILKGINLRFSEGKTYAILGANGVGKSTLLDAIFQLYERHDVRLFGAAAASSKEHQEQIGYMLQNFHTHTDLTALEVVLLGAYNELGISVGDDVLAAALGLLEGFGIKHLANENIQSLSGGQRQMVAFAQVLLKNPRVLLLDEPVSALDLRHQCLLLGHLRRVTRERGLASLLVVHDLNLASEYCDEVILLRAGQVAAQGSPRQILTAELIGEIYGVNVQCVDLGGKIFIRVLGAK